MIRGTYRAWRTATELNRSRAVRASDGITSSYERQLIARFEALLAAAIATARDRARPRSLRLQQGDHPAVGAKRVRQGRYRLSISVSGGAPARVVLVRVRR